MPTEISTPRHRWKLHPSPNPEAVEELREEFELPTQICALLVQRGLSDPDRVRRFLAPSVDHLHDPASLTDIDLLVDRLVQARQDDQLVAIHGDYDADGMSATALLERVLDRLGFRCTSFVPHRVHDGYGVALRGVEAMAEEGASVLLTCDVGIKAHQELAEAGNRWDMDVLVTDHHLPGETLPSATAVVNPSRSDDSYPFADLAGVGVAFKVLQALVERLDADPDDVLWPHLDLVALGTVCDVMPLMGENRILVREGLKVARNQSNTGLEALASQAGVNTRQLMASDLGWRLGPRLNAVGRLDEAYKGVRLLATTDPFEAKRLARELEDLNDRRKHQTQQIEASALEQLDGRDLEDVWGLVLFAPEGQEDLWHPGVIGIVASRLVERTGRPTFLFTRNPATGEWKGSGRAPSAPAFSLYEALDACSDHLLRYGGHREAAGATLTAADRDDCTAFAESFNHAVRERLPAKEREPTLRAHAVATLEDLDLEDGIEGEWWQHFRGFAPLGEGNPSAVFIARDVQVENLRRIGRQGRHLKMTVRQSGIACEAVGWGLAERGPELLAAGPSFPAHALFEVEVNSYRGRTQLQLVVRDLKCLAPQEATDDPLATEPAAARVAGSDQTALDL